MGKSIREDSFYRRSHGSQKSQNKTKVDFGTCRLINKEKRAGAPRDNCLS